MSGICGYYSSFLPDETCLKNSVEQLNRRGNNLPYFKTAQRIGLAQNGNSVFCKNIHGYDYWIVLDGKIYNKPRLVEELNKHGIFLDSHCIEEIILHLYHHLTFDFLHKLSGEFALAIANVTDQTLFIARDQTGAKPLSYFANEQEIFFASELKSLIEFPFEKKLDTVSLSQYLQLNYIPEPYSIYQNVSKLLPGEYVYVNNSTIQKGIWHMLPTPAEIDTEISFEEAKEKLRILLDNSITQRIENKPSLGCFLSGGIDSTIITALTAQKREKLHTFSIGYADEPMFDETPFAEIVAHRYNTQHHVFRLTNADLLTALHGVIDYLDEPYADSSGMALNILSKMTKKHVNVVLSGDGADELFAGYNKHEAEFRMRNGGFLANLIRFSPPIWKILPKSRNSFLGNKIRQLDRFAGGIKLNPQERYIRWCAFTTENDAFALITKGIDREEYNRRKAEATAGITGNGTLNDVLYSDMHLVMRGDMLPKVDKNAAPYCLDVRAPILAPEVVDFAMKLPYQYKINASIRKYILKDCFKDVIPAELYNRPKHGFEMPLLKWFRHDLKSLIDEDLLSESFIERQGIFSVKEISKLKASLFSQNPGDATARIYALIIFQAWWKKSEKYLK